MYGSDVVYFSHIVRYANTKVYLLDVLVQHVGNHRVDTTQVMQVLPSDVELLLVMLLEGKLEHSET